MAKQISKTEDKKEQILDVAEKLFADNGFEAVSVREIAKAASINIAMISYYFGSKENLYKEVIVRKMIPTQLIYDHTEQFSTYAEQIMSIIDVFVDRFFKNRQFQILVFREIAMSQRKELPEYISNQLSKNFSILTKIIQSGIKSKEFRKVDPEFTVMTIISILVTYTTSEAYTSKLLNSSRKEVYNTKNKNRIKSYIKQLISHHLDIKQ